MASLSLVTLSLTKSGGREAVSVPPFGVRVAPFPFALPREGELFELLAQHQGENMESHYQLDEESQARFEALFKVMGIPPRRCRSCGRAIYFIPTGRGSRVPYTTDGVSHFADCPDANSFRRAANS